uniref:Contactin associated protein family member 5 n=1 Tax=Cyclopterus lumpus TaxID=8103 RepID=A0A8C3G404_CYCLU
MCSGSMLLLLLSSSCCCNLSGDSPPPPSPPPGAGGWSPVVTEQEPWLQVDLKEQMEVTAVATQGRFDSWDWVGGYLLLYSDTGRAWKQYRHEDGRLVGNVNSEAVVQNKLSHPVRTRFLRFVPLDWNPSGWMGLRVEAYGCSYKSYVADFDGRSSLLYRFNQKSMSTVKDVVSLRFKSHQAEGVLLHGEGQRGDYITLELHRGALDLYLNLGDSGRVAVTVGSLLDDQQWHSVHIERFNKQVNLTVDSHTQHFHTKGEGHSLEVDYELSFGGIPLPGKPGTFLRKNFHGCVENLYYNGINVIDLAKRRKPQIHSVGNVTFSCSPPQLVACTFLSSSSSFLSLPAPAPAAGGSAAGGFSVRFQFRTWNPDALLLSVQLNPEPRRLELQVNGSRLQLTLHGSERTRSEVSAGESTASFSHHMKLHHFISHIKSYCHCPPGCPPADCQNPTPDLQGCVRLVFLNSQPVDLNRVQQGLLGNYNELQFDTCNIRDRCLPNLCEHGGRCSQTWSSFSCDCSGTGYSGATCHNSIYESSCEAYKLIGSSSGFYSIDPDGSGPLGPAQVYCNMTEEKVWTVLAHDVPSPVAVRGSSLHSPHVTRLNYSASAEQLRSVVTGAEQCQQEVVYNCKKPDHFNPLGGPLTWWLDWEGERRSYWGGFLPGVQQCSCSLEENCVDMNYFCNCDADTDAWANDTGILSYKDHLPVSQIAVGDTNRTGSRAVYHIGPLRCYGDKSLWNAASFYQESSYLYFPTLQAELASDISFYFKTSAPSGVFLENQGLKDFIRVELSSPSVVTFSFDVGNGPAVLTVKSHLPLNDRQWHYVRAERNVKEASLQVDQLPLRLLEAPADGHLRLRLSSQLFVEVSVSFDTESSVTYTFQEPFSVMQNRRSQASSVSAERSSSSRAREDVAFSFVTSQRPAMLLAVSTFSQQYIAVILAKNGSLQIWYHLQTDRSPDVFSPVAANMADGRLHRIRIHRVGKNLYVQVREALGRLFLSSEAELISIRSLTLGKVTGKSSRGRSPATLAASRGFVGCLSSVQFNHVAPLKAALTNRGSSLVTVRGPLVQSNCGALAESTSHTLQAVDALTVTQMHFIYLFTAVYGSRSLKKKKKKLRFDLKTATCINI